MARVRVRWGPREKAKREREREKWGLTGAKRRV